jgi:hypothetical protein
MSIMSLSPTSRKPMLNKRINPSYKLGELSRKVALSVQTLPREVDKCILPNYNLPSAVSLDAKTLIIQGATRHPSVERPLQARKIT